MFGLGSGRSDGRRQGRGHRAGGFPRPGAWLGALALALAVAAAAGVAGAGPVLAGSSGTASSGGPSGPGGVTLQGHGWGHGVGLGQWGALGYALQGMTYTQMLDHYYGGTRAGTVPDGDIRVRMVENDGSDIIVTSGSAFTVAGIAFGAGQAALMHLSTTPGTWTVSQGPGCAGPWTQVGTASDGSTAGAAPAGGGAPSAVAVPSVDTPDAGRSQVLELCVGSSGLYLRGSIRAAEINGVARTVDVLPIEQYLRSVVPSESPAGWGRLGPAGAQGQPQGFQALEAQAVAARSYAAAAETQQSGQGGTGAYGYADVCDTTSCQVYSGLAGENPTTDPAVADTAGEVRVNPSGAVVSTEFSSSTGGWTAGGSFPAVVDDGDSVCVTGACNPYHTWSATVSASSIQSAYPSIGTFQSLQVTSRSGPASAAEGGRVDGLAVQGSAGSVTTTGATFAGLLGLRSDWFAVTGTPSGGLDGYWLGAADGGIFSFGGASFHGSTGAMRLNAPVVGMAATPSGAGYWLVASDGGIFCFGDARFFGSTGALRLNRPVVGMAPTADGAGYWLVASDGGIFTFGDARFLGSAGGRHLSAPMVGMAPSPDGRGYWLLGADGGILGFGDARVLGSAPAPAGATAVGMAATPDGAGYWVLDSDGEVHAFGTAPGLGPVTGLRAGDAAASLTATRSGQGYLVATREGLVYPFGDAPTYGGLPDQVSSYTGRVLAVVGHPGG